MPRIKNPLDEIKAWFEKTWPELTGIKGLYLTGGQVWRRFYGLDLEGIKDVDLLAVNDKAHAGASDIISKQLLPEGQLSDAEPSMTGLGGEVFFTRRGRVDLFQAESAMAALKGYSDDKAHARMAVNLCSWRFVMLPSQVTRKPGERYIIRNEQGVLQWEYA